MSSTSATEKNKPVLKILNYLSPSLPIEFFETLVGYLEEKLTADIYLMIESRFTGPPETKPDPFEYGHADIMFVSTTSYLKLVGDRNPHMELLPVAMVHEHDLNPEGVKGYYTDIIFHVDNKNHVGSLLDLRGCRFAYSSPTSLSSSLMPLRVLKEKGENASFFSAIKQTDSHAKSIQMVARRQVEAAAVDSNTLNHYIRNIHADDKNDVMLLQSLGPLPPYPILVNKKLPDRLKTEIVSTLTSMDQSIKWTSKFKEHGVVRFVKNSTSAYDDVRDLTSKVKNTNYSSVYY